MDRTVLITGGTGALGGAVTKRFLDDGYRVAVTWAVKEEAEALSEELGGGDVLVHLVGAWKGGENVHEHSLTTWDRMMDLNLRSAFLCSRAVLPGMRERDWGRVVLVSSRTAHENRSGQAAYAIAKAGVAVLAETIAEESRGTRITANVIAPSTLDTPANRRAMPDADHSAWVSPADIAASIAFLASDEAGQLRGAWLPAYGSA